MAAMDTSIMYAAPSDVYNNTITYQVDFVLSEMSILVGIPQL